MGEPTFRLTRRQLNHQSGVLKASAVSRHTSVPIGRPLHESVPQHYSIGVAEHGEHASGPTVVQAGMSCISSLRLCPPQLSESQAWHRCTTGQVKIYALFYSRSCAAELCMQFWTANSLQLKTIIHQHCLAGAAATHQWRCRRKPTM
jgi:hypothetical protein